MKLLSIILVFIALSKGQEESERPCPDACIQTYTPVCGSDGVTYSNACRLSVEACKTKSDISVLYQGECRVTVPCPEVCPFSYVPVCGSDGITYSNACALAVEACKLDSKTLSVAYAGECSVECEKICTMDFNPVCGTDGITYSNVCNFEIAACRNKNSILIQHTGECQKSSEEETTTVEDPCPACTKEYRPVCGSDLKTYGNLCLLDNEACQTKTVITLLHQGECTLEEQKEEPEQEVPCPEFCTMNYEPVCGSNWVTYSNLCLLQQAACQTKTQIVASHPMACSDVTCTMKCSSAIDYVCGSDGITYNNACMMLLASCQEKKVINVAYQGECAIVEKVECNDICTMIYAPVCGSNGITYGNRCSLDSASCHSVEKGLSTIQVVHEGSCSNEVEVEINSIAESNKIGLSIGLGVLALVAVVVGAVIYKKRKTVLESEENSTLIQNQVNSYSA